MSMISKFLGALFLLAIFVGSSINKFMNFPQTVNTLMKKLPFNKLPKIISQISVVVAIILLFGGSLAILYSIFMKQEKKNQVCYNLILGALILFTVLATLLFHNVAIDPSQKIHFMKNLAIIGGLILLIES
jgi:putative oxidoreductase